MTRLVLATGNAGKLRELQALLADSGVEVLSQKDFDVPDADETGLSFVENAILKARHAARLTGLPALADDSGLAVDALGGAPGIYSARYAADPVTGAPGGDAANNAKLLATLAALPPETPRTARFVCVLALVRHADDPLPVLCQASWEGEITLAPAGDAGFGYDPLFLSGDQAPDGRRLTSAELARERKAELGHRGQALRQLKARWAETGL
ncbi:non-canonical purine NTP pyrophosphatase, RdgB/HAM1 family [Amnimonas aquatica]|uniref:dITP/XTP pyrophosphatase n=2 Tax=Amnimonas aquatica TaxID=2094561 RepID=A0A2P6ASF7_9GAMM|nr:non-canonical purine NTP pyrophosphatase, RdgB/HAM1 family [Amnimonas aquatica]